MRATLYFSHKKEWDIWDDRSKCINSAHYEKKELNEKICLSQEIRPEKRHGQEKS